MARSLAVELAGAEVDVGGAVAVHPGLGDGSGGAGIAGVESDGLSQALWKTAKKQVTPCNSASVTSAARICHAPGSSVDATNSLGGLRITIQGVGLRNMLNNDGSISRLMA